MTYFNKKMLAALLPFKHKIITDAVVDRCIEATIICVEDKGDNTRSYQLLVSAIDCQLKSMDLVSGTGKTKLVASTTIEFQDEIDIKIGVIIKLLANKYAELCEPF
jgi:hypothetical protein